VLLWRENLEQTFLLVLGHRVTIFTSLWNSNRKSVCVFVMNVQRYVKRSDLFVRKKTYQYKNKGNNNRFVEQKSITCLSQQYGTAMLGKSVAIYRCFKLYVHQPRRKTERRDVTLLRISNRERCLRKSRTFSKPHDSRITDTHTSTVILRKTECLADNKYHTAHWRSHTMVCIIRRVFYPVFNEG
jgi:hypothetical protein